MPIDITRQKETYKFKFSKDYLVNFIASFIPSSIIISLLYMLGMKGAIVPFLVIFGFAYFIGKIRNNYNKKIGKVTSWKDILFWVFMNILLFGLIMLLLTITT